MKPKRWRNAVAQQENDLLPAKVDPGNLLPSVREK